MKSPTDILVEGKTVLRERGPTKAGRLAEPTSSGYRAVYAVLAYILRVAVRAEDADHRRAIRGGKDDG